MESNHLKSLWRNRTASSSPNVRSRIQVRPKTQAFYLNTHSIFFLIVLVESKLGRNKKKITSKKWLALPPSAFIDVLPNPRKNFGSNLRVPIFKPVVMVTCPWLVSTRKTSSNLNTDARGSRELEQSDAKVLVRWVDTRRWIKSTKTDQEEHLEKLFLLIKLSATNISIFWFRGFSGCRQV